jgi:predicted PurR-regulated permease PerM
MDSPTPDPDQGSDQPQPGSADDHQHDGQTDAAGDASAEVELEQPLVDAADELPEPNTTEVDLDPRSVIVAFVTVVGLVAVAAIAMSGTVTTLIVLGVLFAMAMDPVVDRLEVTLHLRRGYAVALLMGILIGIVLLAVGFLGPQTVEQAKSFQDDLPHVVSDLGSLPVIGPRLAENDVPAKIQEWAAQLPRQLAGDTSQITNAAETATTALLATIGTIMLMIALLVDGPWLVDTTTLLVPVRRRRSAQRYGRIIQRVIGRYFAGSLVLGILQAAQVLITGLILGVPLSPLLAVWAGVWNMVPQIGGAIGGIVFVLVAFTQGATTGVIAGVVFFAYMTFSNNVLLPVILGKAVDISPLSTMAATIGGFFVAGVIGAVLAVPIMGAAKAMYHEIRERHIDSKPRKPGNVARVAHRIRRPPGRASPNAA